MTELDLGGTWARVVDSPRWRRFLARPAVGHVRRAAPVASLDRARRRADASLRALRWPHVFDDTHTYLLFLGTVKSGGTLLGALLDAHPEAVIADEVDVLDLFASGLGRREVFHLLAKNARREAQMGRVTARRLTPYSLAVPGQWQGRYRSVRVVGSTRAGPTTRRLGDDLQLLDELRSRVRPSTVKAVHVVRNPFDSCSAMVLRSGMTVRCAVDDYLAQAERVARIRARLGPEELVTVAYEDLLSSPCVVLERLCGFAGLASGAEYLTACAGLVRVDTVPERDRAHWSAEEVDRLLAGIEGFEFLRRPWEAPRGG
jgi:hypothetical protein